MKSDYPIFFFFCTYGWLVFLCIFIVGKYTPILNIIVVYAYSNNPGNLIVYILFWGITTFLGFMIPPVLISIIGLYYRIIEAIFPKY